jgi:hypothetical protein
MKHFGKILKMALVIIMVFSMIGCVQAPSITVPNGHVPTISENITSLAQSSNSTVKSRKYYYVDSIAERGTGNIVSSNGEGVSTGRISFIRLHRVSDAAEKISFSGNIVYPGGSKINVGQICCLVTLENAVYGGIQYTYLVFGS